MMTLTFITIGMAILMATVTVLNVAATRPSLQPATVNPFGPSLNDFCADTMPVGSYAEITLTGDWQSVELNRRCDAEALLDTLEANHHRGELEIVGNDCFTVRWR